MSDANGASLPGVLTHAELVARASRWLRNTKKFTVVLSEIGTDGTEFPDVIGWSNIGESWLIECKASRSDFLADRKKSFRLRPSTGLGSYRVFATPPGMVRPEELPPRWGLIEIRPKTVKVVKHPARHELPVWIHMREKRLLMSAFRRATEGWGLAVFGDVQRQQHGQVGRHAEPRTTTQDVDGLQPGGIVDSAVSPVHPVTILCMMGEEEHTSR